MSKARVLALSLVVVASITSTACGDDAGAEACERFADVSCVTDQACNSSDPCSLSCDSLGDPDDPEALELCVDEMEAITLPGDAVDPLGHAMACGNRTSKKLECLGTF
jgi:hypothetical protein